MDESIGAGEAFEATVATGGEAPEPENDIERLTRERDGLAAKVAKIEANLEGAREALAAAEAALAAATE